MTKVCCGSCAYFMQCLHEDIDDLISELQGAKWDGYCKRYPESIDKDEDDFCGEWEKRP